MNCIVLVDRFLGLGMVPVVEFRRDHQPVEATEIDPEIGVDEGRVEADEQDLGIDRALAETKDSEHDEARCPRDQGLDHVQA